MRRIKVLLAVIAAVATMMALAAPAMASHRDDGGVSFSGNGIEIDGISGGVTLVGSGDRDRDSNDCRGGCNDQSVVSIGSVTGDISFS